MVSDFGLRLKKRKIWGLKKRKGLSVWKNKKNSYFCSPKLKKGKTERCKQDVQEVDLFSESIDCKIV